MIEHDNEDEDKQIEEYYREIEDEIEERLKMFTT